MEIKLSMVRWVYIFNFCYWNIGFKICENKTQRVGARFIAGTLICPTVYSILWFGILGAEGILMQRKADSSANYSAGRVLPDSGLMDPDFWEDLNTRNVGRSLTE